MDCNLLKLKYSSSVLQHIVLALSKNHLVEGCFSSLLNEPHIDSKLLKFSVVSLLTKNTHPLSVIDQADTTPQCCGIIVFIFQSNFLVVCLNKCKLLQDGPLAKSLAGLNG